MINNKSKQEYKNIKASIELKQRIYNIDTSPKHSLLWSKKAILTISTCIMIFAFSMWITPTSPYTLYVNDEAFTDSMTLSTNEVRGIQPISLIQDSMQIKFSIENKTTLEIYANQGSMIIDEDYYTTYTTNENVVFTWELNENELQNTPELNVVYEDKQYTYTIHLNSDLEWIIERGNENEKSIRNDF